MSAYIDLIFLLIVVALIFLKLRSVLGTNAQEGMRMPQFKIISREQLQQLQDELAAFNEDQQEESAAPKTELDQTLSLIPGFSRKDFCRRCATVFEMVLQAFASADEKTLKMLTGKTLFNKFKEVIASRQEEGLQAETDLIKLDELVIEKADISAKGIAKIVVRFISEQVNLIKNSAGEVVEGDENFVQKITDIWTFEKNINSNSPVWLLVSTKKSNA